MTSQKLSEKHEEILEAIWSLEEQEGHEIAQLKKTCDTEFTEQDLNELQNRGLVKKSETDIYFTDQGKIHAEKIVRRHRLTEVLVNSILRMKSQQMHEIACQVEHTLLPEVEEAICILLGHPIVCPDGKAIPSGKCCSKNVNTLKTIVRSLNELKPGEQGKISYIRPASHSQLHQMFSFGLNPGVKVMVHRTSPAICIKFDNTELALDEENAKSIFVIKTREAKA